MAILVLVALLNINADFAVQLQIVNPFYNLLLDTIADHIIKFLAVSLDFYEVI